MTLPSAPAPCPRFSLVVSYSMVSEARVCVWERLFVPVICCFTFPHRISALEASRRTVELSVVFFAWETEMEDLTIGVDVSLVVACILIAVSYDRIWVCGVLTLTPLSGEIGVATIVVVSARMRAAAERCIFEIVLCV